MIMLLQKGRKGFMKVLRHSNKIQKRILCVTLSGIMAMCLLISLVSYYLFHNYLQVSLIRSAETNLRLLSDTIDNSLNDVYRMARFCQVSPDVVSYIEKSGSFDSSLSISTYERITEEYNNNPSSHYIPRVAVISQDRFLQACNPTYSTNADLAAVIPKLPYYDALLNAKGYDFSMGFTKAPFSRNSRKNQNILTIIRPITYQYSSVQGGFLYIEISEELFAAPLERYGTAEDSNIYLKLGNHTYLLTENKFEEIDTSFKTLRDMTFSALTGNASITQILTDDGKRKILVSTPLNLPDCWLCQSISQQELYSQQLLFWIILGGILIGIIAIGILLMLMMNRMIHIPVAQIRAKIDRISGGDFSREPAIEWDHELGDIGKGINDLSESVYTLMNKRLEDEKQKKDLEYQMLQSQINPHFLYNTLNSIKWMAAIQGADGISEMTTALSRLLRSISKGTSLSVPIREELSLLSDYCTIQNYRYGGTITFAIQVDDDAIYDSLIIKFTLQPLVENAIFHGIEPKGSPGHITIHAFYEDSPDNIRIDVTDDGVGMSPEKARQVLQDNQDNQDNSADFFRQIGINNVHKRILYQFGPQYGITIDSQEGQYTTMSVHIPAMTAADADRTMQEHP